MMSLDDAQLRAATCDAPLQLIQAGPGSGKTRTLVARVEHLIGHGVDPAAIAAVTFSRQAADEMAERVRRVPAGGKVLVTTFHAFALRLLGKNPRRLQSTERNAAVCTLVGALCADRIVLARALAFTHLLVDEFQDADPSQRLLVDFFVDQGRSVWLIGDPDQSIYTFRTKDAEALQAFSRRNSGVIVHPLAHNYRSHDQIVRAARELLSDQALNRPFRVAPTHAVQLRSFANSEAEACYVADAVAVSLAGEPGASVAVLYREHVQFDHWLRDALSNAGVSFARFCGGRDTVDQESENDASDLDVAVGAERVTCSTIHGFKGREADHVFLLGVQEGFIPSRKDVSDPARDEARRLLYVAMTRARRSLTITWAEDAGQSRFIRDERRDTQATHPAGTRVWLVNERDEEKDYVLTSGDRIGPGRAVGDRTEQGRQLSFAVSGEELTLCHGGEIFYVVRVESPPAVASGTSIAA